jgi:hypothetical protein
VSFHFGLPAEALLGCVKATRAKIVSSATTVAEPRWLEAGHLLTPQAPHQSLYGASGARSLDEVHARTGADEPCDAAEEDAGALTRRLWREARDLLRAQTARGWPPKIDSLSAGFRMG